MKAVFDYRALVARSHDWFTPDQRDWMWARPRRILAEFAQNPRVSDFPKVFGSIQKLTAWSARRACLEIDGGRESGWNELGRFLHHQVWDLKTQLLAAEIRGDSGRTIEPTMKPFHLLGMAYAFRDSATTCWLGELICGSRNSRLLGYWGRNYPSPFRSYMCELHIRAHQAETLPDDIGPYTGIFVNWNLPGALALEIKRACDFHVERIDTGNPEEYGEFQFNPHDIFPSEILALYRVREKIGLETPWVKHPLLDTPFTQVPENITYEPDPLVVQAMDLVAKLLPEAVAKR